MTDEKTERAIPGRAWVVLVLAGIFICWIGYNTQVARDRTETVAGQTLAYAAQTNDCLEQIAETLKRRSELNDSDAKLNANEREALQTLFTDAFSADLADTLAKQKILDHYFSVVNPIREQRASNAKERANNAYPDPNCGNKLPGQ